MPIGSPRPNAGRPRGSRNLIKMDNRLGKARDVIADFLEANPDFNPIQMLADFAKNTTDEALACSATMMLAKLCHRPLQASHEKVHVELGPLDTYEDILAAVEVVTRALSEGHMCRDQGRTVLEGLSIALDAGQAIKTKQELDVLRGEVKQVKHARPALGSQQPVFHARIVEKLENGG